MDHLLETVSVSHHKWKDYLYVAAVMFLPWSFMTIGKEVGNMFFQTLLSPIPQDIVEEVFQVVDSFSLDLLSFSFVGLLLFEWVILIERRSMKGLGFVKKGWLKHLLSGFGLGCSMITAIVCLQLVTGSIFLSEVNVQSETFFALLYILPFWLVQGCVEEMLSRGWILPVVGRKLHPVVGIMAASGIFAVMHLTNPSVTWIGFINIALFGILASLHLMKSGNIWGIIGIHTAWNYCQGNLFGMNVSGLTTEHALLRLTPGTSPDYLSGDNFGLEGSLFTTLVIVIYTLWLVRDCLKNRNNQSGRLCHYVFQIA